MEITFVSLIIMDKSATELVRRINHQSTQVKFENKKNLTDFIILYYTMPSYLLTNIESIPIKNVPE